MKEGKIMIKCSVCSGVGVAQFDMPGGLIMPIQCPICCGRGVVDDYYCKWLYEHSRTMFLQQRIKDLDIMNVRINKVKAGVL